MNIKYILAAVFLTAVLQVAHAEDVILDPWEMEAYRSHTYPNHPYVGYVNQYPEPLFQEDPPLPDDVVGGEKDPSVFDPTLGPIYGGPENPIEPGFCEGESGIPGDPSLSELVNDLIVNYANLKEHQEHAKCTIYQQCTRLVIIYGEAGHTCVYPDNGFC